MNTIIHIQPFDGNPLEWLTFWDIYSNAVHNNHKLNNIDKLQRSERDFRAFDDITKLCKSH